MLSLIPKGPQQTRIISSALREVKIWSKGQDFQKMIVKACSLNLVLADEVIPWAPSRVLVYPLAAGPCPFRRATQDTFFSQWTGLAQTVQMQVRASEPWNTFVNNPGRDYYGEVTAWSDEE